MERSVVSSCLESTGPLPPSVLHWLNPWAGLFHCTCAGRQTSTRGRRCGALSCARCVPCGVRYLAPSPAPAPGCKGASKPHLKKAGNVLLFFRKTCTKSLNRSDLQALFRRTNKISMLRMITLCCHLHLKFHI